MSKPPKRISVRPAKQKSIVDRRYKRLDEPERKIKPLDHHPLVVLADLRAGSLKSLELYLARHRGRPDRQVALELRKLISGSQFRASFRLLVVPHPDLPKSKGGRPPKSMPTEKEIETEKAFRAVPPDLKRISARTEVGETIDAAEETVRGIIKRVTKHRSKLAAAKQEQDRRNEETKATLKRKERALSRLRNKKS